MTRAHGLPRARRARFPPTQPPSGDDRSRQRCRPTPASGAPTSPGLPRNRATKCLVARASKTRRPGPAPLPPPVLGRAPPRRSPGQRGRTPFSSCVSITADEAAREDPAPPRPSAVPWTDAGGPWLGLGRAEGGRRGLLDRPSGVVDATAHALNHRADRGARVGEPARANGSLGRAPKLAPVAGRRSPPLSIALRELPVPTPPRANPARWPTRLGLHPASPKK